MNRKKYWIIVKRQGQLRSDIQEFDPTEMQMAREIIIQDGDEIVLFADENDLCEVRDLINRNQVTQIREEDRQSLILDRT